MDSTKWKFVIIYMLFVLSVTALAQDNEEEKKLGWFFTAEVAGLWTGGNSESRTGQRMASNKKWEPYTI